MFRVSLANAFAKRTCTPLYEKHQATPFAGTLNATEVTNLRIYSGMVASLNSSGEFIVQSTGASDQPFGLFALDCNATINDLDGQPSGTAPFAVWTGGPDALFKVSTLSSSSALGAFEDTGTFAVGTVIYGGDDGTVAEEGQITDEDPSGPAVIGRVIQVVSATSLIVQVSLPADSGL
jgi:hypothetical protein